MYRTRRELYRVETKPDRARENTHTYTRRERIENVKQKHISYM